MLQLFVFYGLCLYQILYNMDFQTDSSIFITRSHDMIILFAIFKPYYRKAKKIGSYCRPRYDESKTEYIQRYLLRQN